MSFTSQGHRQSYETVPNQSTHIACEAKQEEDEELVISVAQTIVDEGAVVIKSLHTPVAVIAVSSIFRSQVLTVDAYIIKMKLLTDYFLHKAEKFPLLGHIARIYECKAVEKD